jgi:hypothetical protein
MSCQRFDNRPRFRQPPIDVLRSIFRQVLPPNCLLDPSLAYIESSPWCEIVRMKKSLTLVCRSWNSIAIEFLYEFIALRQLGHIPGLLRTFRADSSIGVLVKRIAVILVPTAKNRRLVASGLSSILKVCTNLKELTFPHYWTDLPLGTLWWISADLLPQLHLAETLTRLHLPWCNLNDPGVVKQLNSCTNLVELGISTYCSEGDVLATAPFQNSGRTILRKLEHLRVKMFRTKNSTPSTGPRLCCASSLNRGICQTCTPSQLVRTTTPKLS